MSESQLPERAPAQQQPQRSGPPSQRRQAAPSKPEHSEAEIASLASRGLLFRTPEENTAARDQALRLLAAEQEKEAEAEAKRIEATAAAVRARFGKED